MPANGCSVPDTRHGSSASGRLCERGPKGPSGAGCGDGVRPGRRLAGRRRCPGSATRWRSSTGTRPHSTGSPPSSPASGCSGMGFDRDVLLRAGIESADAFAAVSSGDNSNIISARVAREIFGVERVVARIYDAKRAAVYERLGIPTVATVPWTTDRLLNVLDPRDRDHQVARPDRQRRRSPSCRCTRAGSATGSPTWRRRPAPGSRSSSGSAPGCCPTPKTVIQAGDQVYLAAVSGHVAEALAIAALPPADARTLRSAEAHEGRHRRCRRRRPVHRPRAGREPHEVTLHRAQPRPHRRRRHPGRALAPRRRLRAEPAGVGAARGVRRGDRRDRRRQGQRGALPAGQDRVRGAAGGGPGQRPAQRVAVRRAPGASTSRCPPRGCWPRWSRRRSPSATWCG